MSVVVKGMRIPENCSECMNSDLRTTIKCVEWTEISAGRRENERAWSCPLVDLGKHGDLIDRDELKTEFPKDTDWEYPVNTNEYVCEMIDKAKTVIEAEDGT
jgi:hypothetical protein